LECSDPIWMRSTLGRPEPSRSEAGMMSEETYGAGQKESIDVIGSLTDEGVECQALREKKTNELYTLLQACESTN
jgi:hypothetical protein